MNVISLFDGMSSLMSALLSLGVKPDNYYACEIDKYSEAVSKYHYPDIIRLGDVTKVSFFGLPKIDLLVAGFPCQSFSLAGKQLNFDDPRGQLFFEVVRLIHELQPKYFLLENVRMKKEIQDEISRLVGVQPIQINSSLLSAQNRVRNYWTNIPGITQPADRGILLRDIIEESAPINYLCSDKLMARIERKTYSQPKYNPDKTGTLNTKNNSGQMSVDSGTTFISCRKVANINPSGRGMNGNVYDVYAKSPTLTTNKGEGIKITGAAQRGRYLDNDGKRLDSTVDSQAGLTEQRIELRNDGKSNCLSTVQKDSLLSDGISWRKLTPLECERLQTYADNYTKYGIINDKVVQISDSQRYKMIGNGFTKDVVEHDCSFILEIINGKWVNLW